MKKAILVTLSLTFVGAAYAQAEVATVRGPEATMTQFCNTLGEKGWFSAFNGLILPDQVSEMFDRNIYTEDFQRTVDAMAQITSHSSCKIVSVNGNTLTLNATTINWDALPETAFGEGENDTWTEDSINSENIYTLQLPTTKQINGFLEPLANYLDTHAPLPTVTHQFEVTLRQRGDVWLPDEDSMGQLFDTLLVGERDYEGEPSPNTPTAPDAQAKPK